MKKLTSLVLIFFFGVVSTLYVFGFFASAPTEKNSAHIFQNPELPAGTAEQGTVSTGEGTALSEKSVASHNATNDCYLIINNKVYDVSSYIDSHPGGRRQITSRCGQEVSGIFASIHSNRAWDLLASYQIGVLEAAPTTRSSVKLDLSTIETGFQKANPDAEVVSVKPKNDFYVIKTIYNNKLFEVHVSSYGEIIKEEVENDEFDWSLWDNDSDDQG